MTSPFFQQAPAMSNTFLADSLLQAYLEFSVPREIHIEIFNDLKRFGERAAGELLEQSLKAENEPPVHIAFDPWGARIDRIQFSEAWKYLEKVAAEEGLIAIGYERKQKSFSRLYQFAKLFLFHPSSAFVSCPLAMTDGAARALEVCGKPPALKHVFDRLTSRNTNDFWTSGQWMTERTGGSDVSETSTIAKREGDHFALYGDKWFSSGTGSQTALALARIEGSASGSRGLSLFCVELRDQNQNLKKIKVNRLKDKLGTNALATAELSLEGTPAILLGEIDQGVKSVSSMLNVTRIYNSVCAIASSARAIALAKDYAKKRKAFGKTLDSQPLHLQVLADLQANYEACFHLTFFVTKLLGKDECGEISEAEKHLLRLLTPIVKLFTAKMSVAHASEILESFGGAGYCEDTGIPKILRDAQVFSIWEGTTNVLSLDLLRVLAKKESISCFQDYISNMLSKIKNSKLQIGVKATEKRMSDLSGFLKVAAQKNSEEYWQASSRNLAFNFAQIISATLMFEFAEWCDQQSKLEGCIYTANRFALQELTQRREIGAETLSENLAILKLNE